MGRPRLEIDGSRPREVCIDPGAVLASATTSPNVREKYGLPTTKLSSTKTNSIGRDYVPEGRFLSRACYADSGFPG